LEKKQKRFAIRRALPVKRAPNPQNFLVLF